MIPDYDEDLYSDEALADPYGHYRNLRDLGPVVWLSAHDVYVVSRYADARAVLGDPVRFRSGQGVGLNDVINEGGRGTTLMSDGESHRRQRDVIGRPLTPKALAGLRPDAQSIADELVAELMGSGSFDAVSDLAEVLPATWVPDLLGWPAEGREHLLQWAGATFDCLGPPNERVVRGGAGLLEMAAYAAQVAQSDLPAGSMGAGVLEAAARGEIDVDQCPMVLVDYLGPSLDTTVAALGNAVWLFATHPEEWTRLRNGSGQINQAFNEVLRLESPISGFTRVTAGDVVIDGVELPAGARVLVNFASANRDERQWDDPEAFDITRNSAGHLGFGFGDHTCVGMGLARLEASVLLATLLRRVDRFDLDGPPVRKLNNLIRSFASLPVTVVRSE